jgi:thymidylate synthase (FAD)
MKVEYVDHMGDDITVVNSARVSFDKFSEGEGVDECVDHVDENGDSTLFAFIPKLKESDKKLVRFLAKHNHFTPFTHEMITLRESVPIFVARQRFKHVIGFSYNEVSRRYVSDTPDFHVPGADCWRTRPENIKQGSSENNFVSTFKDQNAIDSIWNCKSSDNISDSYMTYIIKAKQLYEEMLNSGVCPEQARMILPQSMMTEYFVTGSLYAWARAYNLRKSSTAQFEIRGLAAEWNRIVGALYPISWEALTSED